MNYPESAINNRSMLVVHRLMLLINRQIPQQNKNNEGGKKTNMPIPQATQQHLSQVRLASPPRHQATARSWPSPDQAKAGHSIEE